MISLALYQADSTTADPLLYLSEYVPLPLWLSIKGIYYNNMSVDWHAGRQLAFNKK